MMGEQQKVIDISKMAEDELRNLIHDLLVRKIFNKKPREERITGLTEANENLLNEILEKEKAMLTFRKVNLEEMAKQQGETTICPQCGALVPNTPTTWFKKDNGDGTYEVMRYCALCETGFKGGKK
jgi:hypothetical protein